MKQRKKNSMKVNCVIIGIVSASIMSAGCGRKDAPPEADETVQRLAVRAQAVETRRFERRLTVQGTLESEKFAEVSARVDGNLDEIWVDEGDAVVAGKTELFQIDPVGRQNALTIAEQNLEVSRASLEVARATVRKVDAEARKAELDFERYARLYREGKVTDHEHEARQLAHEQARAGLAVANAQVNLAERHVRQAEASLTIARKNLDDTRSVAPISGRVSARHAEPGELMSVGKVVLRIDDVSSVEAAAFLPSQYHGEVEPGKTRFRLNVSGRDAGMHTISYRSPTINPTLRTFEIKGLVDGQEAAVPGSMADLTIVFEARDGLGVPSSSVLLRAGRPVVFVVTDDRAFSREIQTGLQNDGWTEITSGLEEGDVVITEGQTQLRDNDAVEVL